MSNTDDPNDQNIIKAIEGQASWFSSAYMNASYIGNSPTGEATYDVGESSSITSYTNMVNTPSKGETTDGYNTSTETTADPYSTEEYCPLYWAPPTVKVFQTHDKTNFIYFTDETFYQNRKITLVRDVSSNISYSVTDDNTNEGSSMLWVSSSNSYSVFFVDGTTLGNKVSNKDDGLVKEPYLLPAFFINGPNSLGYQPSVIEFDMHYDDDTKMIDLLFWVNEFIDPYYTETDRGALENKNNRNALYYSKGSYQAVEITVGRNKFITNTFIFSTPVRTFTGHLGLSTNIITEEKFT